MSPLDALHFCVYTRAGCELCDELLAELAALPCARGVPVDIRDVDAEPAVRARYGHKVPVLLYANELVCHGHLNIEEVDKALAYHRRPV